MRQATIKVYSYEELCEEDKEKILERFYDVNVDYDWWHCCYEDFHEVAAILGIEIENIYFEGFSVQGQGAMFTGEYHFKKGMTSEIKKYAPLDKDLHTIAKNLTDIQKRANWGASATVTHSGRGSHELCASVNVTIADRFDIDDDIIDDLTDELRSFMQWMFHKLWAEYDYLTGREAIEETIIANGYEFREGDLSLF